MSDALWTDHRGATWPEAAVKDIDKLRTALCRDLASGAKALQQLMQAFKAEAFDKVSAFVDLSAAQYGVSIGGARGNLTLRSFDGLNEVVVQVAERLVFDERLKIAEKLVGECLTSWSEGSRAEIRTIVQEAFRTDKEGNVSTAAVLRLRRIKSDDLRWETAMRAVADSLTTAGSCRYIRFYERENGDAPAVAITLDFAKL